MRRLEYLKGIGVKCTLMLLLSTCTLTLVGQEYKCLYHAMNPLMSFRPKTTNDYRITFRVDSDSIVDVKVNSLKALGGAEVETIKEIASYVSAVRVRDLKYCFDQYLCSQKFVVILSGRNYVPLGRERNISASIEEREKYAAKQDSAVFINLGIVFYHESDNH